MLSSIINGPIDTDKLDYLVRDSKNCFLKYGEIIDFDRMVRNLTVIITKNEYGQRILTLGTYEKGRSAAESFAFARYLLYQSLYWHHTARASRAMLREAAKSAFKGKGGQPDLFLKAFQNLLGVKKKIAGGNMIAVDDILDLIGKYAENEFDFIEMIKARNYYKRILTVHRYPLNHNEESMLNDYRNAIKTNADFQEILRNSILEKFQNFIINTKLKRKSILTVEKMNETIRFLKKPGSILCDCPKPPYGSTVGLKFIPEPKKLKTNYYKRFEIGEKLSDIWYRPYNELMKIVSKGRVFCHPEIRDVLLVSIGEEGLKECLLNSIKITQ